METLSKEDKVEQGKYSLFSVLGVEVEYMIVDAKTLDIVPIADIPLKKKPLRIIDGMAWNNELAAHVIELNLKEPLPSLKGVDKLFANNIKIILDELKPHGAKLLPGSIHPWMNPKNETYLWPHEGSEIYQGFNRIFDCYRHGWSNLQSIHLNFPFRTEQDFRNLHSSLRILLPIIPAIAASSPFAEGQLTGFCDYRMDVYSNNQAKFPVITGDVVPDVITSYQDLKKKIYDPIREAIAHHDKDEILDPVWVNSRGLLPRFDRGSIEVRVIDSQESPLADMAIAEAIFFVAQNLTLEKWANIKYYETLSTKDLVPILRACIRHGEDAMIDNLSYLKCFGVKKPVLAKELWLKLFDEILKGKIYYEEVFSDILRKGTLAKRLLKAYRKVGDLKPIYEELSNALEQNQLWY